MEPTAKFFQPAWVVNYPEADVNWTRISEYKHSPNQPAGVRDLPGTVIYRVNLAQSSTLVSGLTFTMFKEYSTDEGDPY